MPLDELLVITREFIYPKACGFGLDRCLRRHGVSNLKDLIAKEEGARPTKTFKDTVPGFVHIDVKHLPQIPDEEQRRSLWCGYRQGHPLGILELLPDQSCRAAQGFLKRLIGKAAFKIHKVLTENEPQAKFRRSHNGKEFTDRFAASGEHPERPTPLRPPLPNLRHRAPLDLPCHP